MPHNLSITLLNSRFLVKTPVKEIQQKKSRSSGGKKAVRYWKRETEAGRIFSPVISSSCDKSCRNREN